MPAPVAVKPHARHARLAEQIIGAARSGAWPIGKRITELHLSEKLDVSRTPVRAALQVLAQLGVVTERSTGGYALAVDAERLADVTISGRESADQKLHFALIRDRLEGKIKERVSQASLVRRYQIGVPTVQRVLRQMEQEGLIVRSGWQWSFAPTLQTKESRQASYELRIIVEPQALLLPGFRIRPEEIQQLLEEHKRLLGASKKARWEAARIFHLDTQFHEILAKSSGNPFVLVSIRQQNALRHLLEFASYRTRTRVQEWCKEHMAILIALKNKDNKKASQLLRKHLQNALAGPKLLEENRGPTNARGARRRTDAVVRRP